MGCDRASEEAGLKNHGAARDTMEALAFVFACDARFAPAESGGVAR
jgi:hypothetical protein